MRAPALTLDALSSTPGVMRQAPASPGRSTSGLSASKSCTKRFGSKADAAPETPSAASCRSHAAGLASSAAGRRTARKPCGLAAPSRPTSDSMPSMTGRALSSSARRLCSAWRSSSAGSSRTRARSTAAASGLGQSSTASATAAPGRCQPIDRRSARSSSSRTAPVTAVVLFAPTLSPASTISFALKRNRPCQPTQPKPPTPASACALMSTCHGASRSRAVSGPSASASSSGGLPCNAGALGHNARRPSTSWPRAAGVASAVRKWSSGSCSNCSIAAGTLPPAMSIRPSARSVAARPAPAASACAASSWAKLASSTRASGSSVVTASKPCAASACTAAVGSDMSKAIRRQRSCVMSKTRASCSVIQASAGAAVACSGTRRSKLMRRNSCGLGAPAPRPGLGPPASQPPARPTPMCTRNSRGVTRLNGASGTFVRRNSASTMSTRPSTRRLPAPDAGASLARRASTRRSGSVSADVGVPRSADRTRTAAATPAVRARRIASADTSPYSMCTARPTRGLAGGVDGGRNSRAGSSLAPSRCSASTRPRSRCRSALSGALGSGGGSRRASRRSASAPGAVSSVAIDTGDSAVPAATSAVTAATFSAARRAAWPAAASATITSGPGKLASRCSSRSAWPSTPSTSPVGRRQASRPPRRTNQSPTPGAGRTKADGARPGAVRSTVRLVGTSTQGSVLEFASEPALITLTCTTVGGTASSRSSRSTAKTRSRCATSARRRTCTPAGGSCGGTTQPSLPSQRANSASKPAATASRPASRSATSSASPANWASARASSALWRAAPLADEAISRSATAVIERGGPCGPSHASSSADAAPRAMGRRHGSSGWPRPCSRPEAPSRVPVSRLDSRFSPRCSTCASAWMASRSQACSAPRASVAKCCRRSRAPRGATLPPCSPLAPPSMRTQPSSATRSSSHGGAAPCAKVASSSSSAAQPAASSTRRPLASSRGTGTGNAPSPATPLSVRPGACTSTFSPAAGDHAATTATKLALSVAGPIGITASSRPRARSCSEASTAVKKRADGCARSMSTRRSERFVSSRVQRWPMLSTTKRIDGPMTRWSPSTCASMTTGPASVKRQGCPGWPVPETLTCDAASSAIRSRSCASSVGTAPGWSRSSARQ